MQGKGSAFCGSATSLGVRYTGKPVSGWGGLVAVMRYLEKLGVRQVCVANCYLLPGSTIRPHTRSAQKHMRNRKRPD